MTAASKMGSFFLCGWVLLASAPLAAQGEQILLPNPPNVKPPPARKRQQIDQDLEDKRQHRLQEDKSEQPPEERSVAEIRKEKLVQESIKPRPMRLHLGLNLVYPLIRATGPRENYALDPGALFHLFWRHRQDHKTDEAQLFYGFRLLSVTGSGVYKNIPGRFGFTYFGPMIGVGKFSLAQQSVGEAEADGKKSTTLSDLARRGYMLMGGLALQSRSAVTPAGTPEVDDDLNQRGVALDVPGIWSEAQYFSIFFGAVHVSATLGVQLGKGKTIFYLGGGVGGWD